MVTSTELVEHGDMDSVEYRVSRKLRADPPSSRSTRRNGLSAETLRRLYRHMVRTRVIDEKLIVCQRQGRIGFHIGSLGEEASIIGSAAALRDTDWIFPSYREFGALLMRGMPLTKYLGNMLGNSLDAASGRQMPDHYTGRAQRFACVSSPIATQLSHAVGFAWAARNAGEDTVVAAYCGEGGTSSGEFHAGLNFAGVFRTPNVFLVRNNGWAISCPAQHQTASHTFAEKASAYGVRGVRCDGTDVEETYAAVAEAVRHALLGHGPTLVEMVTHRLGGHSTADDPSMYRSAEQEAIGKLRDPVARLRRRLEELGVWSETEEVELLESARAEVALTLATAEAAPPPSVDSMFDDVFAAVPQHLEEQRIKARAAATAGAAKAC